MKIQIIALITMIMAISILAGAQEEKSPPALECIGSIGESVSALALQGHMLYVGCGYTLRSIDLSDPAKPKEIGWLRLGGNITRIAVRGRALYIEAHHSEAYVEMVDASDPARLRDTGFHDGGNRGINFHFLGDFLYIDHGGKFSGPGYSIYIIKNPLDPHLVATGSSREESADNFITDGKQLYSMNNLHEGKGDDIAVEITDCTTAPKKLIAKALLKYPDFTGFNLDKVTGQVRVADKNSSGTLLIGKFDPASHIWDRSNASESEKEPIIDEDTTGITGLRGGAINSENHLAVGWLENELVICEPHYPNWEILGHYRPQIDMESFKVADRMVYAIGDRRVSIIDCGKPERPMLVGGCDLPSSVSVCAVENDILYAMGESGTLYAVNVARPAAPALRSSLALGIAPESMATSGNRLFIAAGEDGLLVVDTTNPSAMKELEEYETAEACLDVATSGTLLYGLTARNFLVLDASGSGSPILKSTLAYHTPDDFGFSKEYVLKRLGNVVYAITTNWDGVIMHCHVSFIDVSDPAHPRIDRDVIQQDDLPDKPPPPKAAPKSITSGWLLNLPFRSHSTDGTWDAMGIYDLSDPLHPEYIGEYSDVFSSRPAVMFKNIIYKTDKIENSEDMDGGLLILRVTDKSSKSAK